MRVLGSCLGDILLHWVPGTELTIQAIQAIQANWDMVARGWNDPPPLASSCLLLGQL